MDPSERRQHELPVYPDVDGVFDFDGPGGRPSYLGHASNVEGVTDVTPRPSLFSDATTSSAFQSQHDLPASSRRINMSPSPEAIRLQQPTPLSTLARRSSPRMHTSQESSDEVRSSAHRRRIPKVEKDADDPTSSVPNQDPFLRPETTTSSLSRLFAMRADTTGQESRSPSYNSFNEYRHRTLAAEPPSLSGHLYVQGLLSGKHFDITVNAFGCAYKLHRLMLVRSPFFDTALSGPWAESSAEEMTLLPEDVDANITQVCFELALKRLYGAAVLNEEASESVGLFATGCWLEMTDLIDSSIESMLRQMAPDRLNPLIKLVTSNYYGRAGDRILASAKAMLCRDGWKMPLRCWDGIPADIIREIVGGDGFYVNGEWDRWLLARKILNRRLRIAAVESGLVQPGTRKILEAPDFVKLMAVRFDNVYRRNTVRTAAGMPDSALQWISIYTSPEVEPLLVLLDEGIHYIHLDFEHLQHIRDARDVFGLPLMPEKVVSDALWMQLQLRQKVTNASEGCMELGLSRLAEDEPSRTFPTISPVQSPDKGKQRLSDSSQGVTEQGVGSPSNSWDGNGKPRKFWIPSADCNIVMGGDADPVIATTASPNLRRHVSRLSGTLQPEDVQWASDFGAASADTRPLPPMRPALLSNQTLPVPEVKPVAYTHFPPFRFAAEFPNPRLLKEKKRVYSRTIFYAGSLWNIYIQKVKTSKNSQLGVYLHRAKERESDEAGVTPGAVPQGSVDERIGLLEREMLLRHDRRLPVRLHRDRRRTLPTRLPFTTDDADSSGSNDATDALLLGPSSSDPQQRPRNTVGRLSDLPTSYRKSRQTTDPGPTPDAIAGAKRRSDSSDSLRHALSPGAGDTFFSDSSDDDSLYDDAHDPRPTDATTKPRGSNDAAATPTLPTYVDLRPTIKTYFKIYSPSKGGRMLSVYESAPDKFNFSQSWGWKSSTLMLDEGMDGGGGGGEGSTLLGTLDANGKGGGDGLEGMEGVRRSSEGRLRFMVVIGNI